MVGIVLTLLLNKHQAVIRYILGLPDLSWGVEGTYQTKAKGPGPGHIASSTVQVSSSRQQLPGDALVFEQKLCGKPGFHHRVFEYGEPQSPSNLCPIPGHIGGEVRKGNPSLTLMLFNARSTNNKTMTLQNYVNIFKLTLEDIKMCYCNISRKILKESK